MVNLSSVYWRRPTFGVELKVVPENFAFGREVSSVIANLLREAAATYSQTFRAEAILWSAQAIDPTCLPVYFSLYKFYFCGSVEIRVGQRA